MQEFRQELQIAETKDKKFTKRKTVLKKIVANITMGNDSSCRALRRRVGSLLTDVPLKCQLCSLTLYNVSGHLYWKSRRVRLRAPPPFLHSATHLHSGLPVSHQLWTNQAGVYSYGHPKLPPGTVVPTLLVLRVLYYVTVKDCNDRNPLIRALAIRTMSYIPIPVVLDNLTDQLRHHLKDRDPYVRKTAAICVAKLYAADSRKAERGGFVELLRDLLVDSNATVVANAVAALSEIADRPDGVVFKLNLAIANKLIAALGESSE
jgi:AP-2 complex subunit beta-1